MKDEKVKLIIDVSYFLVNFLILALVVILFCQLSGSEYKYMASVGKSWNKSPISFIDQSSDYCIADSRVIANDWPGTVEGCYCGAGLYGGLSVGRCKSRKNYRTCDGVAAKPAIPYEKWRGKSICAVRDLQSSYLNQTIAPNEKACPPSTRSCGIIDTLNNVLCVSSLISCPINKITVASAPPSDMNYTTIATATGPSIYFSNQNTKGKVLIDLFISDLQPCADPGNVDYLNQPYILDPYYNGKYTCNDGVGSFNYDDSYTLVDTYSQQKTMDENFISPVVATLPSYDFSNDNHANNLYSKYYIGINPSCMSDINAQGNAEKLLVDLIGIETNINSAFNLSLWTMISAAVAVTLVIFHIVLWFLNKIEGGIILGFLMFTPTLLMGVVFICSAIMASSLKNYSSYHSFFLDTNCVDSMTLSAAQKFYPNIFYSKAITIASAVISSLLAVSSLPRIYYLCKTDN